MLSVVPLVLASSAVLTVDDSGGADFIQIAHAVQAAGDGDTILVAAGSYSGFTIDARSLTIVADLGAVVDVLGSVVLANGAADDVVLLQGLRVQGALGAPGLAVDAFDGSIVIDDCLFIGDPAPATPAPWDGAAARIADAARIAISDTSFFGVDSAKAVVGRPGGAGLVAVDSNVHLANVLAQAGDGADADLVTAASAGGAGIDVVRGQLHLQGCKLRGGDGGSGSAMACTGGGGGASTVAFASRIFHRGTSFDPGLGGAAGASGCADGPDGRTFDLTGGTLQLLPGPSRAIDISPSPAREGELVQLAFRATGGDVAVLAFSPEPAFDSVPGLAGLQLVGDPLRLITLGAVPSGGALDLAFSAPDLGLGASSMDLHCQLLTANPATGAVLGENDVLILLDGAL